MRRDLGGSRTRRPAPAGKGAKADDKPVIPKVVKVQRWPRYWATRDRAEEGASDSMGTAYFVGYDDTSVVYTGQDVIRFLDRTTGKQRKQVVLKNNRLICTSQPRRQIENGIVLLATGVEGVDDCQRLEAYDAATGALKWTYGQVGKGGELTIAQRDGVVLFTMNAGAGEESAGLIAGARRRDRQAAVAPPGAGLLLRPTGHRRRTSASSTPRSPPTATW